MQSRNPETNKFEGSWCMCSYHGSYVELHISEQVHIPGLLNQTDYTITNDTLIANQFVQGEFQGVISFVHSATLEQDTLHWLIYSDNSLKGHLKFHRMRKAIDFTSQDSLDFNQWVKQLHPFRSAKANCQDLRSIEELKKDTIDLPKFSDF